MAFDGGREAAARQTSLVEARRWGAQLDGGVGRGKEVERGETERCGARARRNKGKGSSEGDGGAREEIGIDGDQAQGGSG